MSKLTIDGFLFCVIACAACTGDSTSSTPTGGTTTDPFLGKWSCTEHMTGTFTSPPGVSDIDETEKTIISITGSGGALTARKESDSGSACSVSFTSSGTNASLSEGQTCTTKQGISLTYKSGSATVSGTSLNSSYDFDAAGTVTVGGMMVAAMASGTQTSTCLRVSPPPSTTGGGMTTTGGW